MIQNILVGIDGSEPSRKAARFAHDLAQQTGARLTLLYVLELPEFLPLAPLSGSAVVKDKPSPEHQRQAMDMLNHVAQDLPKAKVDKVVELGRPAVTLLELAEKLHADMIVVGAHGMSAVRKWLIGSVSDRVVQHATCPVTVVR